jgi:hypothetical protein
VHLAWPSDVEGGVFLTRCFLRSPLHPTPSAKVCLCAYEGAISLALSGGAGKYPGALRGLRSWRDDPCMTRLKASDDPDRLAVSWQEGEHWEGKPKAEAQAPTAAFSRKACSLVLGRHCWCDAVPWTRLGEFEHSGCVPD